MGHLRCLLRLWSGLVIATNRPGFYEAQEAALTEAGGGTLWRITSGCAVPVGSYRPHMNSGALWQLHGLAEQAFGPLVMLLARISGHPYAAYDRSYLRLYR